MLSFKYLEKPSLTLLTLLRCLWYFKFKNDVTWVFKRWKCFLNGEFLCFTLLYNFARKFRKFRRANLEKSDLKRRATYQFCIFDSFNTCFGVSIRRTTVIRRFEWFTWLAPLSDWLAPLSKAEFKFHPHLFSKSWHLGWYTWQSGNSSDCQMALQTNHFVHWTIRGSSLSSTEQLVNNC